MSSITRRDFIKTLVSSAIYSVGTTLISSSAFSKTTDSKKSTTLAVAKGGTPEDLVRKAVDALGGMRRFISNGDVVVVKPNIAWDRTPEEAANTNPDLVKVVVKMCLECGAKRVKVLDRPCNDPRRCYERSGIKEAVLSIGNPSATIEFVEDIKFVSIPSKSLKGVSWLFYKDVLEADKVINLPIAKHHNATRLTMALKNIMGIIGGNRGNIHRNIDENIADLNSLFQFNLIILDAIRILTANGPQGGRLKDVKILNTVVVGTDPVAVDSFGATLFGITGKDVPHIVNSAQRGLGEIDLRKVKINYLG